MDYFEKLLGTLSTQFGNVLPGILGAIVTLIIGFILAKIVRKIVTKMLNKTQIDEKLQQKFNTSFRIDSFIAMLVYYLIILFTLLIVLNLLGVDSVLAPLSAMLDKFTGYIPNIIVGGIIGYAGYIIATIVSEAGGFLTGRLESFTSKNGINTGNLNMAKIIKQLIFIFVFIPILIIALDALKIDVISKPASAMLETFMNAIPNILGAAILIAVFFIAGKFIVQFLVELLSSIGLDDMTNKLGLGSMLGESRLSDVIGKLAMFFIMFTGVIAAVDKLELTQIGNILENIFTISGKVFFGIVILLVGNLVANLASKAVADGESNSWLAPIVKFAAMGLFLAFALHTIGIAENIVELAFGLTLGSIAIAFALSFGLGGREAAGEVMKKFFKKIN